MIPWLPLLFEAGLATLMVALIVYCVKLNRRLAVLRSQDTEIRDLISGLRDASERADVSVQRLKAAGLAAERSLRAAIEEATRAQANLARSSTADKPAESAPPARTAPARTAAARTSAARTSAAAPAAVSVKTAAAPVGGDVSARKAKRDMLMGQMPPTGGDIGTLPERPKTREEAEETLLQAIRSARAGV